MDTDQVMEYLAFLFFFLLTVIFSLLTNGLLLRFAKTLGIRQEQHPELVRWTSNVKPSVGGFSFYILFLIALSIYGMFSLPKDLYPNKQQLGIVFSVSLGFLIGLADDAYNTYPLLKFIGQLLCAFFLIATGTIIEATPVFSVNAMITILWVVGIMNSINMLDNMDGICSSVCLSMLAGCYLVLAVEGNLYSFYAFGILGVAGALAGFLFYNWHPAKIYMGDTGSQFLGAFVAAVSIPVLWQYHEPESYFIQFRQFLIPLLVFIIPFIDTSTVFLRRMLAGKSPFVGGRDHTTHHLAYNGLNEGQVNLVFIAISIFSAVGAAIFVYQGSQTHSVAVLTGFVYLSAVFGVMQYYYDRGKNRNALTRKRMAG